MNKPKEACKLGTAVSLLDSTLLLLHSTKLTMREIAEKTGLNKRWMEAISQGRIDDPGVRKIQRLHDFLATE